MKRRTFVAAAAASLPAFSILAAGGARAQSKEIRMIEAGGLSGDSIQAGYIDPLKAKTGINVVRESPSSLGKLPALVESGQTSATLFELGSGVPLQAQKLSLIQPLHSAALHPPATLMKDHEVQFSICWSGRVVGDPAFGLTFAGGKADLSFFAIVKGSKPDDKAAAYKLMHEMSLAENQAKAAAVISYTGPSPDLDALLPKDKLWQYPTSKQNKAVQYFENAEWWADNGEAVNKKGEAFKLNL